MSRFERLVGRPLGRFSRDLGVEVYGDTSGKIVGKALRVMIPLYGGFRAVLLAL